MGVIYIGDRETGKTSLVLELVNPKNNYVKVINDDYETLKKNLYDENLGRTKATQLSPSQQKLAALKQSVPQKSQSTPTAKPPSASL